MKKTILALACSACAFPVWSADVGVGISAESDDSTIYVPIDINDAWRIEPFAAYSKRKMSGGIKDETLNIGAGLFALRPLGESLHVYFGGRLSYLDYKFTQYLTPVGPIEDRGDGYRVAPTLGFEYSFNKHVSLGGEAAWFYEDIDASREFEEERSGTDTKLILRFRF